MESSAQPGWIDTHCHLVDIARLRYPWLAQAPALQQAFPLSRYRAEAGPHDVAQVLYMEMDVAPDQMLDEVGWMAAQSPELRGMIAACRPEAAGFAAHLEQLVALPFVRGLRRVLHVVPDAVSQSPLFAANLRRLAAHRLPFDLCLLARQLPLGRALAAQCPDVQFVLDHCGNPDIRSGDLDDWRRELRALAALPNVVCKLSGITTQADLRAWRTEDLRPVFEHVIDCFGWDRVVWGSDWPVCTPAASLSRWIQACRELTAGCSADERARLFAANARRIYRLD